MRRPSHPLTSGFLGPEARVALRLWRRDPVRPLERREEPRPSAAMSALNRGTGVAILLAVLALAAAASIGGTMATEVRPPAATVLHSAAGVSFIVVGLLLWWRRPGDRVGLLSTVVGFTWFVDDLREIPGSVPFTAAEFFSTFTFAALAHLAIAYPSGRLRSVRDRTVVVGLYLWVVLGNLLQESLWAPAATAGGPHSLLALNRDAHLHSVASDVHQVLNVAAAIIAVSIVVEHFIRASRPARRALAPICWASGPIVLLVVTLNAVGVVDGLSPLNRALPYVTPLAVMTLPVCILIGLLRSRLAHVAVGHLVIELGEAPPPRRLRDAMARTLQDPSLEVYYWVAEAHSYVDAEGRRVDLGEAQDHRSVTFVERGGEQVAALVHDPSLEDDPWLIDAVGAAAALALENERLHADAITQLAEVRASRARLVEAGDAERRRLERDIHDGAQQRLLSAALTLGIAAKQLGVSPEPLVRQSLELAGDHLRLAIRELRDLAAGIHPALLSEAGLGPALQSVVERSAVSVTLEEVPEGRLPQALEVAAYFVVSEALANVAKHAWASSAMVRVRREGACLVVEVGDDGLGGADLSRGTGLRGLGDRVAALDGRLEVSSPPRGGTTIRATIPITG